MKFLYSFKLEVLSSKGNSLQITDFHKLRKKTDTSSKWAPEEKLQLPSIQLLAPSSPSGFLSLMNLICLKSTHSSHTHSLLAMEHLLLQTQIHNRFWSLPLWAVITGLGHWLNKCHITNILKTTTKKLQKQFLQQLWSPSNSELPSR